MVGDSPKLRRSSRVLVAMSGGVDSAIAAYLLHKQWHTVAGATMKLFCYESEEAAVRPCCDMEAIREARRSAAILGIPHTVIEMEDTFRREVVDDFVSEYAKTRTPNPCIRCNTYVKFGPLLEKARRLGYDAVATGHYVRRIRLAEPEKGWGLFRGRDVEKDQSYVLWGLDGSRLERFLFPLGETRKGTVRRLARRLGLRAWDRPESQDICFVPTGEHVRYLSERLPREHPIRRPGPVRTLDGAEVGEHDGLLGYTIGQRRGLRISGGDKLYVVRLDPGTSTLWVGPYEATLSGGLLAVGMNLLAPAERLEGPGVAAKIRYRGGGTACQIRFESEDRWRVRFAEPVSAVAPGQSVVFYQGEQLLGGAYIQDVLPIAPDSCKHSRTEAV